MASSTPLVFFGTDQFSATILNGLLEAGYDIQLVITTPPNSNTSKGRKLSPVAELSAVHNLIVISPSKLDSEAVSTISQAGARYAVLASYGKLLPDAVLECFLAIINVHPSLLPLYRGPSPIEAAILAGDNKTGVSLIKLTSSMDAGPVYASEEYNLSGNENQQSLRVNLARVGASLLLTHLPDILSGKLEPGPQDESLATYCGLIHKSAGQLDWKKPAVELERQIRAYKVWPQSRARLFERDVIVTEASARPNESHPGEVTSASGKLWVGTSDGSLLIERLKPAGRAEMSSAEWLRGLKS